MKKLLLLLLIVPLISISQETKVVQDFGIWTGFDLEKKILKDFDLILKNQIRTFENNTKIDDYLIEIGAKNSINKKFSFSGKIRYTYDLKRFNTAENNFRYSLDLTYTKPLNKNLLIRYRLKHQREFIDFYHHFSNKKNSLVKSVRNKLKLIYEYRPQHKMYSSIEVFRLIQIYRMPYFNKFRVLLGNQFRSPIGELDMSIVIERELNSNYPYSFIFLKTIYKI